MVLEYLAADHDHRAEGLTTVNGEDREKRRQQEIQAKLQHVRSFHDLSVMLLFSDQEFDRAFWIPTTLTSFTG